LGSLKENRSIFCAILALAVLTEASCSSNSPASSNGLVASLLERYRGMA